MNDEIAEALCGHIFTKVPASIDGFSVERIKSRAAPGLIERPGAEASGFILQDVDTVSFEVIAAWEDGYELVELQTSDKQRVYGYKWLSETSGEAWRNDLFREKNLRRYIEDDIPDFLRTLKNQH